MKERVELSDKERLDLAFLFQSNIELDMPFSGSKNKISPIQTPMYRVFIIGGRARSLYFREKHHAQLPYLNGRREKQIG